MKPASSIRICQSQPARFIQLAALRESYLVHEDQGTAASRAEAEWQIREDGEYEYELPPGCRFLPHPAVSVGKNPRIGRIRPVNHVGRLKLDVVWDEISENPSSLWGQAVGCVELEVTSRKLDYRSDYRCMLNDIARRATDLVFSAEHVVSQVVTPDYAVDARTLYQRFAFLKSILESEPFKEAVTRICAAPIRTLKDEEAEVRPQQVRRVTASVARQFARANKMPRWITVTDRNETVDVPENRFVKFVLSFFADFLRQIARLAKDDTRLQSEAIALAEQMDIYLAEPFFRHVSPLTRVPLGSTALQRKEGYREVLRAWTLWETAAKLSWTDGEEVYSAGKKDVASLYEYWCYFKLLDVVQKLFHVSDEDAAQELIVPGENGLTLSLREGKRKPLHGVFTVDQEDGRYRELSIAFSYNRTFSAKEQKESWTLPMRPDYTLSFRPKGTSELEAIANDLITYVHFDAKYKFDEMVEELREFSEDTEDAVNAESQEAKSVRDVKRIDILKMHAYRDAIRRTGGAYVLYPGNASRMPSKMYNEILPGLGAFPLSPSVDASAEIERFLADVATHLCDRITKWEEYNFQLTSIYHGTAQSRFVTIGHIPGFAEAVASMGILPYRGVAEADAVSIRWFVVIDDTGKQRIFRVKPTGYRGTANLSTILHNWHSFRPVPLDSKSLDIWHLFAVEEEK